MNRMFFKKWRQPVNVVFLLTAEFIFLDLTSLKSVRQFVQKFKDRGLPLHVLVNNGMLWSLTQQKHKNRITPIFSKTASLLHHTAGTMLVPERQTEDGFEFHFGLNYLGHFLLTNLFLDILKNSGQQGCCSRIINMSSATHYAGVIQMDDLNRRYEEQWKLNKLLSSQDTKL